MPPRPKMLAISSFSKSFHEERILSIGSLVLSEGVHLLKGENGSGKTTLFKCLAGILSSEGDISIKELSLKKNPKAYRYYVNFAEAEPIYPAFLTARDLLMFVAKTKNAPAGQLEYYREHLGIDWFFEKSCGTYSSGMLKKVSLAIAFLGNPGMIILDEPLITLDELTRLQLFKLIREKKETIFLLSSHQTIESGSLEIDNTLSIENKTLVHE